MAIKWRPATKDDIGMPCRFHDGDASLSVYGKLTATDKPGDMFQRDDGSCLIYFYADVAEHEREPIDDTGEDDRRDAARYRALRGLHWSDGDGTLVVLRHGPWMLGRQTYSGEMLDKAIDDLTRDC